MGEDTIEQLYSDMFSNRWDMDGKVYYLIDI